jgi:flagellar hook-length control protein FliK
MPEPNTTSASPAPSSQTVHTAAIPNPSIAAISVPPPTQNLSVDRVSDVEGLSMADYGLSDGEKMIADPVRALPELPNPTLVRHVSQQLIEALRTHTERPVEVMLSPEELGRVKLSLTTAEAGITVHVLAERPETTDLLRRHIDVLTEDFRNLGYQDINFSFGSDGQNEQAEGSDQSAPSLARDTDETTTSLSPITIQLDQSDGLDIRL